MSFKFNPLTSNFDLVDETKNYSLNKIPEGDSENIDINQEMLFNYNIEVDGTLEVDGKINQIVDYSNWSFNWNWIKQSIALLVQEERDLIYYHKLKIDGLLILEGNLVEI